MVLKAQFFPIYFILESIFNESKVKHVVYEVTNTGKYVVNSGINKYYNQIN